MEQQCYTLVLFYYPQSIISADKFIRKCPGGTEKWNHVSETWQQGKVLFTEPAPFRVGGDGDGGDRAGRGQSSPN